MAVSERSLAGISKEELERLLYQMLFIRRFEEKAAEMYAKGRIHGFLHLYIGQEAIATGAICCLRPEDYVVSHYREHGHALARGMDPKAVMAELFGKATGVSKGMGGSMHLFDLERHFMGGYAIVGGHLPLACGMALSCQHMNTGGAVLCFFGDGSVNEGAFHEALNLAAVWKLPVLFLCENNFYAMGTSMRRVSALAEIYKRAEAYGIRSEQIDGMDVVQVKEHVDQALKLVRRGEGPQFLECITYRYRGHSMADPEFYRSKEEVEHWRGLDPINRFSQALIRGGHMTEEQIDSLKQRAEDEVNEAARFAEESPDPPLGQMYENVYGPPVEVQRNG